MQAHLTVRPPVRRTTWLVGTALLLAAALWAGAASPVAAAEVVGEASRETLPGLPVTEASIHRGEAAPARGGAFPWDRAALLGAGGLGFSFAGTLTGLGLAPSLGLQPPAAAVIGGVVGLGAFGSWAALRELQPAGAGGASVRTQASR